MLCNKKFIIVKLCKRSIAANFRKVLIKKLYSDAIRIWLYSLKLAFQTNPTVEFLVGLNSISCHTLAAQLFFKHFHKCQKRLTNWQLQNNHKNGICTRIVPISMILLRRIKVKYASKPKDTKVLRCQDMVEANQNAIFKRFRIMSIKN